METLIIRHVAGSEPAAFEVLRGIDGKEDSASRGRGTAIWSGS